MSTPRTTRAQGTTSLRSGSRTYPDIVVGGHRGTFILDTGCDQSMLYNKFVRGSPLAPTDIRVYAANGTTIPVVGKIALRFEVAGVRMQ